MYRCQACHKNQADQWNLDKHSRSCPFSHSITDHDTLFTSSSQESRTWVMNQTVVYQRVRLAYALKIKITDYSPMVFLPKGKSMNGNPAIDHLKQYCSVNSYTILRNACLSSENGKIHLPKYVTIQCSYPNCPDIVSLSGITKPQQPSRFLVEENETEWIVSLVQHPSTPNTDTFQSPDTKRTPATHQSPDTDQSPTTDHDDNIDSKMNCDNYQDTEMNYDFSQGVEINNNMTTRSHEGFVAGAGDNDDVGSGRGGARTCLLYTSPSPRD